MTDHTEDQLLKITNPVTPRHHDPMVPLAAAEVRSC